MNYYACLKNGIWRKKSGTIPEHLSLDSYDEVIEISEELCGSDEPIEKKNGKIIVNMAEKIKMEAVRTETKRIKDKVKNKEDISNTELAWLQGHGG